MRVGFVPPCPPVRNDIVTPRHLFLCFSILIKFLFHFLFAVGRGIGRRADEHGNAGGQKPENNGPVGAVGGRVGNGTRQLAEARKRAIAAREAKQGVESQTRRIRTTGMDTFVVVARFWKKLYVYASKIGMVCFGFRKEHMTMGSMASERMVSERDGMCNYWFC